MGKTMKIIGVWTVFFFFCLIQFALANQLVISGDYAFLADGDLKIYNITEPSETDPEVITIGNASAVAVSGPNAVVTIDDGSGELSIQIVDISAYAEDDSGANSCDPNEYLGTIDIDEGVITLPGVALDNTIYTLIMERRGNSNNWEITFSEEVADDDDGNDEDEGDKEEDDDEGNDEN